MHDLRRLRAFHAVAEHRSFSTAGLELGYAQSVVSHHVVGPGAGAGRDADRPRHPAREPHERRRAPARPTPINVLGHVAAAEQELRAIAGLEAGALRMGAFLTACTSFVPAALGRFQAAHPGVDDRAAPARARRRPPRAAPGRHRPGRGLARRARGGKPRSTEEFESVYLRDDHYRFVLPASHRLARRRELRLEDLARERFITTLPGTPYRACSTRSAPTPASRPSSPTSWTT